MDNSLKRKLKSNNSNVRHSAIDELIKIAGTEEISTLIYIAKGKKRSLLQCYNFEDQICAMEALLQIGSQEAINFLKSFFKETIQKSVRPSISDITYYAPSLTVKEHCFKNASGELGNKLYYHEPYPKGLNEHTDFFIDQLVNLDLEAHRIRESILSRI